jgi:hypothetical protein
MVADALIYHPTVAHYLKFVATTGMFLDASLQKINSRD